MSVVTFRQLLRGRKPGRGFDLVVLPQSLTSVKGKIFHASGVPGGIFLPHARRDQGQGNE